LQAVGDEFHPVAQHGPYVHFLVGLVNCGQKEDEAASGHEQMPSQKNEVAG
jgi:hypothetical protein